MSMDHVDLRMTHSGAVVYRTSYPCSFDSESCPTPVDITQPWTGVFSVDVPESLPYTDFEVEITAYDADFGQYWSVHSKVSF